jgi:hypothetical protein
MSTQAQQAAVAQAQQPQQVTYGYPGQQIYSGATYTTLPPQYQYATQVPQGVQSLGGSQAYPQQQVYIDPETIKHQKTSSLNMLEQHAALAKDRSKAEYEAQRQAIIMKAEHEISITAASIEQSKAQALFALDQQHQQRRMEIEQRAQEQRMQIEATASQLTMTAQQQKLQRDMAEKMAKMQAAIPPQYQQYQQYPAFLPQGPTYSYTPAVQGQQQGQLQTQAQPQQVYSYAQQSQPMYTYSSLPSYGGFPYGQPVQYTTTVQASQSSQQQQQ